jgi:hypothetical protein
MSGCPFIISRTAVFLIAALAAAACGSQPAAPPVTPPRHAVNCGPERKGFSSGPAKLAFGSVHFRLAGALPAGPLPGMVRWANGTTLRLPLLSARAAFAELAAERPCAVPNACGQLTVTGAEPGVVTVRTSRGPATVPAWRFTVTGPGWKVSEAAIARSAFVVLPG